MTASAPARLAIIGAGAWGTALALAAGRTRVPPVTTIWAYEAEVADSINREHINPPFLPGVVLPATLAATTNLAEAVREAVTILLAVPAQHLREISQRIAPHLARGTVLVLCAKGIEVGTGRLMTEVLAETTPGVTAAVLSGPTFAAEVAAGKPTAVTLACADEERGRELVSMLGSAALRPYLSDDVIGAQIGGAVKNVIAIACGIVEGRRLGDNARAALMTRGLAEIMRLGTALGGKRETLMGLSGLGDLALTCNGIQSRNMSLGVALGRGKPLGEVLGSRRSVAEGVATAAAVQALAEKHGVDMPIVGAVDAIVHHGADITRTIAAVLERPFRSEA
ncbi:MAG: NAD(P)-dependent glycerol-3-phosphate dehydrogenase [Alphaproteobacteria bacterium]|nr:NAD(P)-dependent glycerol-3-phosphate dehydrogenase [Alphaproteobacteria bacterium]